MAAREQIRSAETSMGFSLPAFLVALYEQVGDGGFEAAVDCLDLTAPVLLYESDVDEVDPEQAWKIDQPTIEDWWDAWVDDRLSAPVDVWSDRFRSER